MPLMFMFVMFFIKGWGAEHQVLHLEIYHNLEGLCPVED